MSDAMTFAGFAEADAILAKIPAIMREQSLKKSFRKATAMISKEAARRAPSPDKSSGGIEYTKRTGKRALRPLLSQNIGSVVRSYMSDGVIVGVSGPVKSKVGRHAHLVEMGFHHTSGGTFAGSGRKKKRTRKAAKVGRTGAGKRGAFVFPRPFMLTTGTRMQSQITQMIVSDLKNTAERLAK